MVGGTATDGNGGVREQIENGSLKFLRVTASVAVMEQTVYK